MPKNWISLAEESGIHTPEDFKKAFHRLVTHQCLYARFHQHSATYRLVSRYRSAFAEAADLLGLSLEFNSQYEFCYVIPQVQVEPQINLQESRFLLTLRYIYHLKANAQELTEEGDVIVDPKTFSDFFIELCCGDIDMSNTVEMKELSKMASRCGLVKLIKPPENDPQPYYLAILPGVMAVLSEEAVNRFGAQLKAVLLSGSKVDEQEVEDETAE